MVIMVAMSRPVSRRCRRATIWKPPGTRMALLTAPGGMRSSTAATSGSTSSFRTQPRSPPCSAVCAWLNWVAAMAKGVPRRSWPTTSSTKRRTSASAAGSSSGMKISETRNSGWPARALALRTASCTSASVGSAFGPSCWRISRAQPIWVRIWSYSTRGATPIWASCSLSEPGARLLRFSSSLTASATSASVTGRRRRAHLLQAQALIDQQPGDLRRQAVQRLRRHGDAGIQGEQPGAADDIGAAHHFRIDHRDDAVGPVGRLGGGRRLRRRLGDGRAASSAGWPAARPRRRP